MSDLFAKLMCSILDSSVWCEDDATVRVWITLLAMKDKDGNVHAALPGLANRARKTIAETKAALDKFMAPDPYSRTKSDDGRRVREIEGGWHIINHALYRDRRHEAEKRRKREHYHRHKQPETGQPSAPQTVAEVPPPAARERRDRTPPDGAEGYTELFEAFWQAYPGGSKGSKFKAFAAWKRLKVDASLAARLGGDVAARAEKDRLWREGFIPHVTTYLNGRIWQSPIDTSPPRRGSVTQRSAVESKNQTTAGGWAPPNEGEEL